MWTDENIKERICSQDVVKEVISKLRKSKQCGAACKTTKFLFSLQEFDVPERNVSIVKIVYGDQEVEHHDTYVYYGLQSLSSEIGGVLGLTLGGSILSMMICVEKIIKEFSTSIKVRLSGWMYLMFLIKTCGL